MIHRLGAWWNSRFKLLPFRLFFLFIYTGNGSKYSSAIKYLNIARVDDKLTEQSFILFIITTRVYDHFFVTWEPWIGLI